MINDHKLVDSGKTDYHFILRQRVDHEVTDNANLLEFQKDFYNYIRSIKDDWKYFGISSEGNVPFCYGKYGFFNKLIRCASVLSIHRTELINTILSDMKKLCKKCYQIDLD